MQTGTRRLSRGRFVALLAGGLLAAGSSFGGGIDPSVQARIDAKVKEIQGWASDPVIVKAVAEQNATPPAEFASMTQEKWKNLTVLDPVVRGFTKNGVGTFLKGKKDDVISEAFVSSADGTKVGFLSKTTNWCHKGKPKHEEPLQGKSWQGPVEVDESTGLQQVQVALPIVEGGKPVGSLVVGLSLATLAGQ